jgi:hypothetical protein
MFYTQGLCNKCLKWALKDEIERLQRQVRELQHESTDKEVKIVQITSTVFWRSLDLRVRRGSSADLGVP